MLSDMLWALSKSSFYSLRRRSGGGREGRQRLQARRRKHRLLIEFEVGYRRYYIRIQDDCRNPSAQVQGPANCARTTDLGAASSNFGVQVQEKSQVGNSSEFPLQLNINIFVRENHTDGIAPKGAFISKSIVCQYSGAC